MAMAATTGSSSSSASAAAAADKPVPALPPLTAKLDPTKYPLWLAQIIPFLNSNGLMSFVDGTATCPPAFLLDADGKPTNTTNPAYDYWIQMDQFVLSLINGSLSHFVVATLEGSISARATWVALEALLLRAEQQHLVPTLMVSVSDHSTAAAAASPGCGFDHVASGGKMSGRGGGGGSGVGGGTTGEGVSGKKGLPGVKSFSPTEQELVGYYLKKQIEGKDSEFRDIIPVIDHVCKREPRDLPAVFFSKPDYKNSKRDRCNRTTDEGKYKITCRDREIKDELSKTVIGKKRYLAFKDHVPSAKKTKYVIHEYSLTKAELAKLGVGPNPNQKKEFVLCCLKSKSANSKKLKDVSICGNELAEPAIGGEIASNSEDDQAAATGMIQGPDEHLLKEPSCADLGVQQLAATSATTPTSATSFGGVGVGSPDGFLWSDFNILLEEPSCADLEVQQLAATSATTPTSATSFGGVGVGSPDGFLWSDFDDLLEEPFWADQPHQPPHPSHPHQPPPAPHPHQPPPPSQPQNYCSSTLPSALCTKQGNVPSLYNDDCSKQLSPTGNNISTNYHYEPVSNTAYSVQNGATDERFSEVYKISTNDHNESVSSEAYLQPEENLGIPSSISATGLHTAVAKEHRTGRCYACQ
ncbi:uncharacterized protein LOC110764029 [Prunus avium]|uniref:Uncharacterized protein LOC110764029 n=1 Tax=Prunus avium TaxID=42229 RepID=A0A6P5T619_PRUAV|nr:uncharacterized protein LOC110764029 [Prunus avium]